MAFVKKNPLFAAKLPAANQPEMKVHDLAVGENYRYPKGKLMRYEGTNRAESPTEDETYRFGYSRNNGLGLGVERISIPWNKISSLEHVPRTKAAGRRRTRHMKFKKSHTRRRRYRK